MQLVSTRRGLGRCGCRLIFRPCFRVRCGYMHLVPTRWRARQESTAGQSGLPGCAYMQLLIGNLLILCWWSCRYMQPSVLFALAYLGYSVLSQELVFGLTVLLPDLPDGGRHVLCEL